jgi:hypothetical protein
VVPAQTGLLRTLVLPIEVSVTLLSQQVTAYIQAIVVLEEERRQDKRFSDGAQTDVVVL